MLFEISNPSDPYTMEAPELLTAALAVTLLGRGHYGLHDESGKLVVPIFLFGGCDEWFREQSNKTTQEAFDAADKRVLADCLDSVLIGDMGQRKLFRDAEAMIDDPAKRQQFWEQYHERERSSMNNIGGRAKALAKQLRKAEERDAADSR